tara:strand:- start:2453 stop:2635 length:183 start_codon:yes stop_codon:yes gene_type:complete
MAAAAGNAIKAGDDSPPSNVSRFSSRPTRKKKNTIRPSLIQLIIGLAMVKAPILTDAGAS